MQIAIEREGEGERERERERERETYLVHTNYIFQYLGVSFFIRYHPIKVMNTTHTIATEF